MTGLNARSGLRFPRLAPGSKLREELMGQNRPFLDGLQCAAESLTAHESRKKESPRLLR
jgi:hypothetical protein